MRKLGTTLVQLRKANTQVIDNDNDESRTKPKRKSASNFKGKKEIREEDYEDID